LKQPGTEQHQHHGEMQEAAQHSARHELLAHLELIGAFAFVRVDRHGVPFDFIFTGVAQRV
jgi:hypothetical protein